MWWYGSVVVYGTPTRSTAEEVGGLQNVSCMKWPWISGRVENLLSACRVYDRPFEYDADFIASLFRRYREKEPQKPTVLLLIAGPNGTDF